MKNLIRKASKKLEELNAVRKKYKKKESKDLNVKGFISGKKETHKVEIDIPTSVIVKVLIVLGISFALKNLIIELQSIVIISSISFFLCLGVTPIVKKIESYHIPRPIAILLLYILFFGVLALLFVSIIPILAEQLLNIADDISDFLSNGQIQIPFVQKIFDRLEFDPIEIQKFISENLAGISKNLKGIAGSTFGILSGIFQGVFNLIFALVLIFFILLEREQIANFTLMLFPLKNRSYITEKFTSIQNKLSEWLRGQFILMVAVGSFMYLGMKLLEIFFDMKYAATLGLVAGIMELFPYIGVLITGLLGILIAINISWILVIAVIAWIGVIQFLEGNILVPMVMEKVVGLSSVVTILALSTGGILGSALGGVPLSILFMILSIPIAASVAIFVEEYVKRDEKEMTK